MKRKEMTNWFTNRLQIPRDGNRSLAAGHLKRCPLCGALNSLRNRECFVCRWRGEFDLDQESIEAGLADLLDRCPELASAMSEPEPPRRFKRSLFQWFGFLFRKRIDLQA
jgi:hypothetical protein